MLHLNGFCFNNHKWKYFLGYFEWISQSWWALHIYSMVYFITQQLALRPFEVELDKRVKLAELGCFRCSISSFLFLWLREKNMWIDFWSWLFGKQYNWNGGKFIKVFEKAIQKVIKNVLICLEFRGPSFCALWWMVLHKNLI